MTYPKGAIVDGAGLPDEKIFPRKDLVPIEQVPAPVARAGGNFYSLGFFLVAEFDWTIVRDNDGCLVLVPTRKGKRG